MASTTTTISLASETQPPSLTRVELLGVPVDRLTETQCVSHIITEIQAGHGGWVVTANVDHLRRLVKKQDYRTLCQNATLVTADGMPLLWAARLKGYPLPERVAGSNLIWSLSEALGQVQKSVFLLGGNPGTAEGTAKVFTQKYPGLRIAGIACPPMGFEKDPIYLQQLCDQLSGSQADMVYVALGSPKQEKFIAEYQHLLPSAWWMGVGISFSFITGDISRAPRWVQRIGFEWVHRLFQEPKRLARRYLWEDIPFTLEMLTRIAVGRIKGSKQNSWS